MGKAGRQRKHSEKMARKRDAKAAKRNAYAALAGTSKKKKNQNGKTGPTRDRGAHVMADCGNPGCKRCYPKFNPPSANVIARQRKEREASKQGRQAA